jgi:recombination protein RecA
MAKAKSNKETTPEEPQESVSRAKELIKNLNSRKGNYSQFVDMTGNNIKPVPRLSTGIYSLDTITGGGWPQGRINEIWGSSSSGKTSSCLQSVASCQNSGGVCAYLDLEHALDLSYAKHLGVNVDDLLFQQPDFGEECFESIIALTDYLKGGDLIVVDSVAALVPKTMYDSSMEQKFMGTQASMISDGLKKITSRIDNCKATLIFVNQTRQNLGVTYGSKISTPGGEALKFYSSIRVQVSSIGKIKKGEEIIGNKTKFKTVKNKTYPPFKEVETELIFGESIPRSRDLLVCAINAGIIKKSGGWISMEGSNIGHGLDKTVEVIDNDPELMSKIEEQLNGFYGF